MVPRSVTDHHVWVLRSAGVRPAAAHSGAMALSCAAGVSDAILVYLDARSAHVVLVRGSMPKLAHRVPLLRGPEDREEQAQAMAAAVEQATAWEETCGQPDQVEALPLMVAGAGSRGPTWDSG